MNLRSSCWRAVLIWGLLWVAAGQASLIVFLEWRHPGFLDPKYGCRLLALCSRRSALQPRTLLLVLGSSRAEQGFRPSLLARTGETPVPPSGPFFYNLARGGSSPLLYLLTLHRLLSDGVHPDVLLVEIFPPALVEDREGTVIHKATLRDWPLLHRYPVSRRTWAFWLQDRLLLWHKYRSGFLAWVAPKLLPPQGRWGEHLWDYRGGEWRVIGDAVSFHERRRLMDDARRRYAPSLQHFRIAGDADRALRELLDTCRTQHIAVVLFLMPESSAFRGWYPPEALRQVSDYLMALHREYGVPLIDARHWIADWEFSDGHHLLSRGAAQFTHRFAKEVLSLHPAANAASSPARAQAKACGYTPRAREPATLAAGWCTSRAEPLDSSSSIKSPHCAGASHLFSPGNNPKPFDALHRAGMLGDRKYSQHKVRPIPSR